MSEGHTFATKLSQAVKLGKDRLAPHQKIRHTLINEYRGNYYGDNKDGHKAPLNTLFKTASLYVPHLVFRDPRALITTANPELRSVANTFELKWNHVVDEIAFRQTLRKIVLDAFFGPAFIKTGVDFGPPVNEDGDTDAGYLHDVGQAFADPVDFDDYIIDPWARTRESCDFEGNRYRVSRTYAFESGLYDHKILDLLATHEKIGKGEERVENIESSSTKDTAEIFDYYEFYDLWLPQENIVVTIPADVDATIGFLREQQWDGPERGPYEMLGFHWVPNNPLPLSLAGIIFDLAKLIDINARKAANQAERQKTVTIYDRVAAEDAETVQTSSDGDMLAVDNVDRFKEISLGGTDEAVYEHLAWLGKEASEQGGNTDLLGGMSAESQTLGQDQMLMQNASIRVDDMRVQVYDFVRNVGRKIAWYIWTDPNSDTQLMYEEQGISVPVRFSPETREGDFLDYNFDIIPYSMSPDNPDRKYQVLMETMERVAIPMLQIAASQGQMPNVMAIMKQIGRYRNMPELDIIFQQLEPMMGMGAMGAPGGSDTTNISLGRGGGARPEPNTNKEPAADGAS